MRSLKVVTMKNYSNNRLDFDTHVTSICNLVSKKLHTLTRISEFMSI